jgi:hypothetical protein
MCLKKQYIKLTNTTENYSLQFYYMAKDTKENSATFFGNSMRTPKIKSF